MWTAIENDGVAYLDDLPGDWGELCASPEIAVDWASRLLEQMKGKKYTTSETSARLSCLLAANRHAEIWRDLEAETFPFWPHRKFGAQALLKEGRIADAIAYAEASHGNHHQHAPEADAFCEELLLAAGRHEEAYAKYGKQQGQFHTTGVNAFRAVARKYPHLAPETILRDLVSAAASDPGLYFAAAKDAGLFELALDFATRGRTNPATLVRACRDFTASQPDFAFACGKLALEKYTQGYGFEVTNFDWIEAYSRWIAVADACSKGVEARITGRALIANSGGNSKTNQKFAQHVLQSIRNI